MNVRVEREGPVTTVILDRPAVRNAVDGPTAAALAGAFRAFDADDGARVAVLWGAGGTFCAGADLKAADGPDGNRAEPDGDGPMGPTRLISVNTSGVSGNALSEQAAVAADGSFVAFSSKADPSVVSLDGGPLDHRNLPRLACDVARAPTRVLIQHQGIIEGSGYGACGASQR